MNLTKKEDEDFVMCAGTVNRECEQFKLNEMAPDMFKEQQKKILKYKQKFWQRLNITGNSERLPNNAKSEAWCWKTSE